MKVKIFLILICTLTMLSASAQGYSVDTLDESTVIISQSDTCPIVFDLDTNIVRTDNHKDIIAGKDSIYDLRYVFKINNDYINNDYDNDLRKKINNLYMQLKNAANRGGFGNRKDMDILKSGDSIAFSFKDLILRSIRLATYPTYSSCFSVTGEMSVYKTANTIVTTISVKQIILPSYTSCFGGGDSVCQIADCFDSSQVADGKTKTVNILEKCSDKFAIDLLNFFNGKKLHIPRNKFYRVFHQ